MLLILSEVVLALGIFMSVITASSAISNEIESGTFESLLLTPITSSQISMQKTMSIITLWIILYVISIPYIVVVLLVEQILDYLLYCIPGFMELCL